jgi:hypothetical protein
MLVGFRGVKGAAAMLMRDEWGGENLRLPASVAVVVLVLITSLEILRIKLGDLLISETVADSRVEFIQCLPLELVVVFGEEAGGCDGALESRGPDGKGTIILGGLVEFDKIRREA